MCRARTKRKETKKKKKETRVEPNPLIDRQRDRKKKKKKKERKRKKKSSRFLRICSQKTLPHSWGRLLMLFLVFDKVSFLFSDKQLFI